MKQDPYSRAGQRLANVSRFLDERALAQPEALALLAPKGRKPNGDIDYLQLDFRALATEQDAWASRLVDRGVQRGDRVLLMVRPGVPLVAITFALFKMGAVPVIIDPGMGLKSFLSCVRRSRPNHLVGISLATWVSRLFRPSFKSVQRRIRVGGSLDLVAAAGIQPVAAAATAADELAAILFTSGSTGPPKGVCYEHSMFEAQVEAIRSHYQIEPGEIDLPMLPIFALFNPAMGMTTVVPEINPSKPATVDPAKITQAIQQCEVTNTFGSPTLWRKIGAYCRERSITLPSVRRILMAGAPVPPGLMEQFREIVPQGHVHSPYGATEVLPVSSISDTEVLAKAAQATAQGKGTCVGRPLPQVRVRVLPMSDEALAEKDLQRRLPADEIGEIVVTGPTVTKAYDGLPEATRQTKIVTSDAVWHRMGDVGYLDDGGRLWFCGRKAERVEIGSKVFFTDQCEGVFNVHPRVFRSALIAWEPEGNEREPALVVEPQPDAYPKSKDERDAFCRELAQLGSRCEATRDIRRFLFRRSLPVDVRHNAKIHRLALARQINVRGK